MKLLLMMIPARVWVIKTCHEQIFGVSLSTEELQLLNILQTFFVLIISTERVYNALMGIWPRSKAMNKVKQKDFLISCCSLYTPGVAERPH